MAERLSMSLEEPKQITQDPNKLNSVLNRQSRYTSGGSTEVSVSGDRLEWWDRAYFASNPNDLVYAVERKFEGNLRHISSLYYGTEDYWWVIAQYNGVLDPYAEIIEGVLLRIPPKDTVTNIMQGRLGGIPSTRTIEPTPFLPIV